MRRTGVLVLVVGLLAACGSTASRPAASTPSSIGRAEATADLAKAVKLLDADGSVHFAHAINFKVPTGTLTRHDDGAADLRARHWTGVETFTSDPASLAASDGINNVTIEVIGTDDELYLTSPGWPAHIRGRWLPMTSADTGGSLGSSVDVGSMIGGIPLEVDALKSVNASSGSRAADGLHVVGTLRPTDVVSLAGLQKQFIQAGVDPSTLAGLVQVDVVIDKTGHVDRLEVSAVELGRVVRSLSSEVAQALTGMTVLVTYDRFGEAVTIAIPGPSQLVKPSEMNP